MSGKVLTKAEIFAINDIVTERVSVPEWGGDLFVRSINGLERDAYESSIIDQRAAKTRVDLIGARARLVALAAVDENKMPIFTEDDVAVLATKSAVALERVYDVAARLAGLSTQDMEALVKNG
jgi:hypothetical protein